MERFMENSSKLIDEKIIKEKKRVRNHGEVFTPKRIVKKMLDLPAIREAAQNLTTTFLEPASGEGIFLTEVLNKKLNMVAKEYSRDLQQYENYSLCALSTLYGIELLKDNSQRCAMNMYQVYYEAYQHQAQKHQGKMKTRVLDSAKLIISKNIVQGNFLTKLSDDGKALIFCEWEVINLHTNSKTLIVQRTEYTLYDITEGVIKESGEVAAYSTRGRQMDFFELLDGIKDIDSEKKEMKYTPVKIMDVYKEEMEEADE